MENETKTLIYPYGHAKVIGDKFINAFKKMPTLKSKMNTAIILEE